MEYYQYGFEPTYEPMKVRNIIENIGSQNKYDVSMVNPQTEGFISIRETGDIEMFADSMLGIRVNAKDKSVNVYGEKLNVRSELNVETKKGRGKIELTEDNDSSSLSQKADYIGINSDRDIIIGNYQQEAGSQVTISAETINIKGSNILINGQPYKDK